MRRQRRGKGCRSGKAGRADPDLQRHERGALEHARSLLLVKAAPDAESLLDVAQEDVPRLVEQSLGSRAGSLVTLACVPSLPMLEYQQLFVLFRNSSHQKSVPLGSEVPAGRLKVRVVDVQPL
jgi:hypothetical protein